VAEQYTPGLQRIFYSAVQLEESLLVRVTLFDSELNNNNISFLTEAMDDHENVIKGLYYFDHVFSNGVYVAYFHEFRGGKWVERGVQVYNIKDDVRGGFRSSRGGNVING